MRSDRRPRDEHGSALPFAVACLGLVLVVAAALGVVAAMVAAHRSAQAAADLAALAGASAAQHGADACASAAAIAGSNGGVLDACTVTGEDVLVTVRVAGPHWLGQRADLTARARAGPSTG